LKENVTEVKKDYECGIALDKFHDVQPGDLLEAFIKEKVKAG
jgi:translation initiation factor IF-2